MMWSKLAAELWRDDKMNAAIDAAGGADLKAMWADGLSYTADKKLDGWVPASRAETLSHGIKPRRARRLLEVLCMPLLPNREALWHRKGTLCDVCAAQVGEDASTPAIDAYYIHEWHERNPTAAEYEVAHERKKAAGTLGGKRRAAGAARGDRGQFAARSEAPDHQRTTSDHQADHQADAGRSPPATTKHITRPGFSGLPVPDLDSPDLDSRSGLTGGSGGMKPDLREVVETTGLPDRLAHVWAGISARNSLFTQVWPGIFAELEAEHGRAALAQAIDAISLGDVSQVQRPRAYLVETVRDHAEKLGSKGRVIGAESGPETRPQNGASTHVEIEPVAAAESRV